MKILERFGGVAGLAGVFCYFLAFFILIIGPAALTNIVPNAVKRPSGAASLPSRSIEPPV